MISTEEQMWREIDQIKRTLALLKRLDNPASSPGDIKAAAYRSAPAGWLLCDGAAISRTTYAALFSAIAPNLGNPTISIASPAVVTLTNHGLGVDDAVYFTTTGALPTGILANTIYYVIAAGLTANNFEIAATRGGAAINTSGTQSGTHSLFFCPYGLGDGSTTFNVPDLKGRVAVGKGAHVTVDSLGMNDGLTEANRSSPTGVHSHSGADHYHRAPFGNLLDANIRTTTSPMFGYEGSFTADLGISFSPSIAGGVSTWKDSLASVTTGGVGTTGSAGGGGYSVLNFFIKT